MKRNFATVRQRSFNATQTNSSVGAKGGKSLPKGSNIPSSKNDENPYQLTRNNAAVTKSTLTHS